MSSNEYHFVTNWRVKARVEEVFDIISNPTDLTRWWPSVYLDVDEVKKGDKQGSGGTAWKDGAQRVSREWAPAVIIEQGEERCAKRQFVDAGAADVTGKAKQLCAGRVRRSVSTKVISAV